MSSPAAQQPSFFWHDYETFGADPRRDRPVAVRRDPHHARSGTDRRTGVVVLQAGARCAAAPGACLDHRHHAAARRSAKACIEAEFAARVHEELAEPGTCGVGYNSLRFDDEFTRHLLYRNFYDPYAREWENGNSRWDLIDLARMCYALRPHGDRMAAPRRTARRASGSKISPRANHVAQRARARCAIRRRRR